MAKKSMLIYLTEETLKEFRDHYKAKYQHISFYGMIVDLAIRMMRKEQ